jgi:hypothetical protein
MSYSKLAHLAWEPCKQVHTPTKKIARRNIVDKSVEVKCASNVGRADYVQKAIDDVTGLERIVSGRDSSAPESACTI